MTARRFRFSPPSIPSPSPEYDRENEAHFRAAVERGLIDAASNDVTGLVSPDDLTAAVDAAIVAHEAEADPHPQYDTAAEVATAVSVSMAAHLAASDPHPQYDTAAEVSTAITAAVSAHEAASDPHPQYETATEVSAAITTALAAFAAGRNSYAHTTASLASGASEDFTIPLTGIRGLKIAASGALRLRVYSTAAYRAADASRTVGVDPTGDHGLLLEVITTGSLLTLTLSPAPDMHSGSGTPGLYATVTNRGSLGALTFTLYYFQLEN